MSSHDSDVARMLATLGNPDMPYRDFAATPSAAEGDAGAVDASVAFPLLAAALPGFVGAIPGAPGEDPTPAASEPPLQAMPQLPRAVPKLPVAASDPPLPAMPHLARTVPELPVAGAGWIASGPARPAPSSGVAATSLECVFRALRGGGSPPLSPAPERRGLQDLFRRL